MNISSQPGPAVSVVADVLDRLGYRSQVLDPSVRPVCEPERLVGRAFTVLAVRRAELVENPYEQEIAAVDAVPAGSVAVFATGGAVEAAIWGELLATRVLARGGVGAVTDGAVRDIEALRRLGVATFAAAISARDSAGRIAVVGFGEPVVCAGVAVRTGDLVVADLDGVVVVPTEVETEALAAAAEKTGKEQLVREALAAGETVADLYARHGVL